MKHDIPVLDKQGLRNFGYVTGAILIGLFGLLLPWLREHAFPWWPWAVAGVLAVWATLAPMSLQPVYKVWMTIGAVLGWINTRIILGLVYYVIFTPIGFCLRRLSRDPMARRLDRAAKTYRIVSKPASPDAMKRPF